VASLPPELRILMSLRKKYWHFSARLT